MMSPEELQRYARQIALPDLGASGQEKLRSSRVLIVGAGGLGSPVSMYLVAAGVGKIGLVDFDRVDASNLHRQLLHGTRDVGRLKVESALDRLRDINPFVAVTGHAESLTSANALQIVRDYDVVVDASDNFPTRYLVNDACVFSNVPLVYGSVERFEGQVAVFATTDGPCYRCLFREPPPPGLIASCSEAGVLGVVPGLIGMLQATEALKILAKLGDPLIGRLLIVDVKRVRFRTIEVRRDPACPVCGTREQRTLIDYEAFCGLRRDDHGDSIEIEPRVLAQRLAAGAPIVLVDVREAWEYEVARLPGARLMPGSSLGGVIQLPRDQEIVLYCHSGVRSHYWLNVMRQQGFERVSHLRGGIDAWSVEVDPNVPRY